MTNARAKITVALTVLGLGGLGVYAFGQPPGEKKTAALSADVRTQVIRRTVHVLRPASARSRGRRGGGAGAPGPTRSSGAQAVGGGGAAGGVSRSSGSRGGGGSKPAANRGASPRTRSSGSRGGGGSKPAPVTRASGGSGNDGERDHRRGGGEHGD